MPYYQCQTCHRAAENSERRCARCRRESEQKAEEETLEIIEHYASSKYVEEHIRVQWRSVKWYVARLTKRLEWHKERLEARDAKIAELQQQLAEKETA